MGGEEDSEPRTDAAGDLRRGWMESLSAISKGGGILNRQSKYHPHC